ncbi:Putative inner membrane protein [Salmonella enterica subsp. enterica]|uniref:Inner membrane protein n=1 Tax=Salmonella enterica I TaxID=59201 RepID=A0A3S4FTS9_SALET|nr:Putative inner membrane protein [Salmonella enterica subsp. enterica]
MSLENAPDEVKLAVDLIVLLEENRLPARNGATRAGNCYA